MSMGGMSWRERPWKIIVDNGFQNAGVSKRRREVRHSKALRACDAASPRE